MNEQLILVLQQKAGETANILENAGFLVNRIYDPLEAEGVDASLMVIDATSFVLDETRLLAKARLGASGRMPIMLLSNTEEDLPADCILKSPVEPQDLLALVRLTLQKETANKLPSPIPAIGKIIPKPNAPEILAIDQDLSQMPHDQAMDDLPGLLIKLYQEGFTGSLTIRAGIEELRVIFSKGQPIFTSSTNMATDIGDLLLKAGLLGATRLATLRIEAARLMTSLTHYLVQAHELDKDVLEFWQKELILQRFEEASKYENARYSTSTDELIVEEPGYPVHVAVVVWRIAGPEVAAPDFSEKQMELYVHATDAFESLWPLLDPEGLAPGLRLVLLGGGRLEDVKTIGGERILPLISLLFSTGVLHLMEDPVDPARRAALLSRTDLEPFRAKLYSDFLVTNGADAYTILRQDSLINRYCPTKIPPGLTKVERDLTRNLYRQALFARRILSNPDSKVIYDKLMSTTRSGIRTLIIPDHAVYQAEQALLLLEQNNPLAASFLLNLAILLEGEDPEILALLGWARYLSAFKDPEAGISELKRALQRDPNCITAHWYLAKIGVDTEEHLKEILSVVPSHQEARDLLKSLIN